MAHNLLETTNLMRSARALLVGTIRLLGVVLVAAASLQLALAAAHVIFLLRQGVGSPEALPLVFAWLGVVAVGLGLYAQGERLADRVMTVVQPRRGAN